MGSAVFTHLTRSPLESAAREGRPAMPTIDRVESIGMLDRRHPIGLACLTLGPTTFATFTYDPALLEREDVDRIAGLVRQRATELRQSQREAAA